MCFCTFLSFENNNVKCLICNCEFRKKSSRIIMERMGEFYCNIKTMDYSKTNPWRVQKLNCSLRTSEKCRKTIWKSSYQPLDFNFHWLNKVSAVRAAYISKICKNSCDYGCVYFLLLWSIYLSSLIKDVQDKKDWHLYLFHCVICSQLLQICFPEVVSMNTFLNINIFCCKRLKCYFLHR